MVISAIHCDSGKDNGIKCNGVGGHGEPLGEGDLCGETRYTVGAKGIASMKSSGRDIKEKCMAYLYVMSDGAEAARGRSRAFRGLGWSLVRTLSTTLVPRR